MMLFPAWAGSTWAAVGAIALLAHCGQGGSSAATGASAQSTAQTTSAPPVASSGDPALTKTPRSPHAGSWAGSFKAEPGEVVVPEGVPYDSWKVDPGGAVGHCQMSLVVADDGVVSGKVTGALGPLAVAGMVDEEGLRAGLTPTEGGDMQGVITGELAKDGQLSVRLRVSNATATVVRKADFALAKD